MKIDYGMVIAVGAVLLFYLRLVILQRQRVKRYQAIRSELQKARGKKQSQAKEDSSIERQLGFRIFSWYLVAGGILLILFGAFMTISPLFSAQIQSYWWVAVVAGIFLMNYSIR